MIEPLDFRTILVPMDFSPAAKRALELARGLAEASGSGRIVLVHGYYIPVELAAFALSETRTMLDHMSNQASRELEGILTGLQDVGISSEYIASNGSPESVIIDTAARLSVDVIVMGTHGRTGLSHLALGSVAERVVRLAPCPVITVRAQYD